MMNKRDKKQRTANKQLNASGGNRLRLKRK